MQTIFDAMEQKRILSPKATRRLFISSGAATIAVASVGVPMYLHNRAKNSLSNTVLSYITDPEFVNGRFCQQVTGTEAWLDSIDWDNGVVNFNLLKGDMKPDTLARLAKDPGKASVSMSKVAVAQGDRIIWGQEHYLIKVPFEEFRADQDRMAYVDFAKRGLNVRYAVSVKEMEDFLRDDSLYDGPREIESGMHGDVGRFIYNFGRSVAKRDEPSLSRLVRKVRSTMDEHGIQDMLDFVSWEIEYDEFGDIFDPRQKVMRPNEVLLHKKAMCGGKVVLMASMLEQTGDDYRLIYLPRRDERGHITVAVAGDFPNDNGLAYDIGGRRYHVAETAVTGFEIGKGVLKPADEACYFGDEIYVQRPSNRPNFLARALIRPGDDSNVFNLRTGKPLKYFSM